MAPNSASPLTRLATYGTLGPGRPNAHQLAHLSGTWHRGTVRGRLVEAGWGAEMGFPGLILDPSGSEVGVDLLESPDLEAFWPQLDAFEGEGYRRVVTTVLTPQGEVEASIYEIRG